MEIDFNGNPFADSRDIKEDFVKVSVDADKVNTLDVVIYHDLKLNQANPFKVKDAVILDISKDPRFSYIQRFKQDVSGRVSAILGQSYVNISFENTIPSTIKNVSVTALTLTKSSSILDKLRVFFKKLTFIRNFNVKRIRKKNRRK